MTNSMTGVKLFTKAIIDSKPWNQDPAAIRKEWSQNEYELSEHGGGKQLCFAIMWDNGIVKPHPPLQRAMRMTKAALEAAGHKGVSWFIYAIYHNWRTLCCLSVINWDPHRHTEIYKCAQTILVSDGGHDYKTVCDASGEPLISDMTPGSDGIPDPEDHPHFLSHHDYQHEHSQWPWLIKVLTGEPFHRSAWEVGTVYLSARICSWWCG